MAPERQKMALRLPAGVVAVMIASTFDTRRGADRASDPFEGE